MCTSDFDKNEVINRFNDFMQSYKIHYLITNEFSEIKQQRHLLSLADCNKLQEDVLNLISDTKINNCKINLCNKKTK